MNNKKWFNYALLFSVIVVLVLGIFNYIIDPYGLYQKINIVGYNQQKEGVRTQIRFVKSLEISLRQPKTIIMGSSRVHDGINPDNKSLDKLQPTYNYGIDMIRIKEVKKYLEHAISVSNIENLFIGLDFVMFNKHQKLNSTFDSSLVSGKISFENLYFKPLFTKQSVINSIKTIKESFTNPTRIEFLSNGYRPGSSVFFGLKNYESLHNYVNWIFLSSSQKETLYYAKFDLDNEVFNDLNDILKICNENNIKCILFINPVHVDLGMIGIKSAKLSAKYELWKVKLSSLAYKNKIPLWDFAYYNSITTEKVITPMKYYWDSAHYKEIVGDYILSRILDDKTVNTPENFGVKLTPSNIQEYLELYRNMEQKYFKENSIDIEKLENTYERALSGEIQDRKKIEGIF